jgi:hypothetical protein
MWLGDAHAREGGQTGERSRPVEAPKGTASVHGVRPPSRRGAGLDTSRARPREGWSPFYPKLAKKGVSRNTEGLLWHGTPGQLIDAAKAGSVELVTCLRLNASGPIMGPEVLPVGTAYLLLTER